MNDPKITALAEFLGIETDRIKADPSSEDKTDYLVDDDLRFIVADDKEAEKITADYIKESLWAFNADFIASHSNALNEAGPRAVKAIQEMQEKLCEDANPIVAALIDDIDHFIDDAITSDGRGHFMNIYDGEEYEQGDFFIYCIDANEVEKEIEAERG